MSTTTLSVVICTRDRPVELERCVGSVLEAVRQAAGAHIQLVVVDDTGRVPAPIDALRSQARAAGVATVTYARNRRAVGLFASRLVGIAQATGRIILFLDDDATIAPEYLVTLATLYDRYPSAAGIGGVDQLDEPRSWIVRAIHRAVLVDSGRPGTLSYSGFAGSLRRWAAERTDFTSEYLAGCNMSFRRAALAPLGPVEWLRGYSLGEDLYVSHVARQAGELVVSPTLRVWHHRSPMARDAMAEVARARVVNTAQLLRLRGGGGSSLRTLGLCWTVAWLVLKDVVRARQLAALPGYLRGIRDLAQSAPPATGGVRRVGSP